MGTEKYIDLFASECVERLDRISALALIIEKGAGDEESLNELFRHAHSIKGMAATMGFHKMSKLSHGLESLLSRMKKKEIAPGADAADMILKAHRSLKVMLDAVREKGAEGELDEGLIAELEAASGGGKAKSPAPAQKVAEPPQPPPQVLSKQSSVKVKALHLDRLIDILSELASLKWQMSRLGDSPAADELSGQIDSLEKLIKEMKDRVLSMRLVSIGALTERLPLMVREVSRTAQKTVELEMEGESIELDKNIIGALEAPIVHLVRNCIDHGIEPAERRLELGKSPAGNIFFKAYRYRNRVVVEVGDDGRGIDPYGVAQRALEMGVIDGQTAQVMTDEKKLLLICHPGLSTSSKVSELSGRGVGMDVVKSSVEALGGTISIYSRLDMGTTFKIDLPLTSAIIKVFVVESSGIPYGIAASEMEGVLSIKASNITMNGQEREYRFDGPPSESLPLRDLSLLLTGKGGPAGPSAVDAVMIKSRESRMLVTVDALLGIEEVIVKPLSTALKYIKGISGVTILPAGNPMFILNMQELV